MSEAARDDLGWRKPAEQESLRTRLIRLLRTPEGRRQAFLLGDILAPPLAIRRRRSSRFPQWGGRRRHEKVRHGKPP